MIDLYVDLKCALRGLTECGHPPLKEPFVRALQALPTPILITPEAQKTLNNIFLDFQTPRIEALHSKTAFFDYPRSLILQINVLAD